MQTITIEILDERVMKLLEALELLQLIRIHRPSSHDVATSSAASSDDIKHTGDESVKP